MLEILEYILGGFWRWLGFTIILYIVLFFAVNGVVQLVKSFIRKNI
jgi:ABC-type multidrug transport system permease subunit